MIQYKPGDIVWMEPWEVESFKNAFELVEYEAGRAAMIKRGFDPDTIERRVSSPPPPPEPKVEEAEAEQEVVEDLFAETEELEAEETAEEEPPPLQVGLEIQRRGTSSWFDVVNRATGEKINDKALRKKQAETLVQGSSL
jgi:hypothetical protein